MNRSTHSKFSALHLLVPLVTLASAGKKSFETDIHESHYPNEVNTSIHSHSDAIDGPFMEVDYVRIHRHN
jgi:hypothetical protein